jgi:hypothetical protein
MHFKDCLCSIGPPFLSTCPLVGSGFAIVLGMVWAFLVVATIDTAGADVHVVSTCKRYLVVGETMTASTHIGLWLFVSWGRVM